MKTQSTTLEMPGSTFTSSLHSLVSTISDSLQPATQRNKSFILNDVPEDIYMGVDEDMVASVLSGLLNIVISHSANSCIRITAKSYSDVVLLHVKDDGCVNYDSISQNLTRMQALAEKLGGFVGFTSYRNKLTTIAFSFMNMNMRQQTAA
ncbi:MAG: HAMP domain-containing histidine kinase [Chitinophagaceae bacterium]|nr:HAMP domain-containing histidine kinase [Chitinophagaceae bacterium]